MRLVLNRFRKVPGFSEADAEAAVGAKLLWRIPNQYLAISAAIDRGTPVDGPKKFRNCPLFLRAGAGTDPHDNDAADNADNAPVVQSAGSPNRICAQVAQWLFLSPTTQNRVKKSVHIGPNWK